MKTVPDIPLVDLKAQYAGMRDEILSALREVVASQSFILGSRVSALERTIARLCGCDHAIACASGSDALILALAASGLEPGETVVTSPFSFFASAGSVVHAGGKPAFCDIDPATFNIDPRLLERSLGPSVRAVVPVHLFGQCADMPRILAACSAHGVRVVEDAAQAIGATLAGTGEGDREKAAGSFGLAGCFSFFPTKNLGGYGDGGMITTSDDGLAERLRVLRVHGGREAYRHERVGWNSRLDEIQAAVLLVKARLLGGWSEARRARARLYDELLDGSGLVARGLVSPPATLPGATPVYHQYTIRASRRDALRGHLGERGIGTGVYYPVPLHLQECFRGLGHARGDFPEAERAAGEVLSLPIYPELTEPAQRRIVGEMSSFFGT